MLLASSDSWSNILVSIVGRACEHMRMMYMTGEDCASEIDLGVVHANALSDCLTKLVGAQRERTANCACDLLCCSCCASFFAPHRQVRTSLQQRVFWRLPDTHIVGLSQRRAIIIKHQIMLIEAKPLQRALSTHSPSFKPSIPPRRHGP